MSKSVRNILIIFLSAFLLIGLIFGIKSLKKDNSNIDDSDGIITIKENKDEDKKEKDKLKDKEKVKESEKTIKENDGINKEDNSYSNNNDLSNVGSIDNNGLKNKNSNNEKKNVIVDNTTKSNTQTISNEKKSNNDNKTNDKVVKYDKDNEIEKIIKNNNLEKYRDIIYSNKELFTKYYKAVESNNNLSKAKRNVYDFFIVIVDNKKYLDEDIFFDKLSTLKIVFASTKKIGISGEFLRKNNLIYIYVYKDDVVYHELMHFVDSSLNSNVPRTIYYYDNKVISEEEYKKLLDFSPESHLNEVSGDINYDEVAGEWSVFLSEAGAEHYSANYFSYSHARAYFDPVALYDIFEYLYSEEKMKDVFFGHESLYGLTNGYFTENEFKEFLNTAYAVTYVGAKPSSADYRYIVDSMIGLYNSSRDGNWYNDEKFCLLLYNFIDFDVAQIEGSKYYDISKEKCNYYNNLFNGYKNNLSSYVGSKNYVYPDIIYENNNVYFVTFVDIETENESIVKLLYDGKNDKLKETFRLKYSRR